MSAKVSVRRLYLPHQWYQAILQMVQVFLPAELQAVHLLSVQVSEAVHIPVLLAELQRE